MAQSVQTKATNQCRRKSKVTRCTRIEVVATLSELVGYKAGLALTKQDIVNHLPEARDLWAGSEDDTIRLHSSTYQELLTRLLYRIGNIETPTVLFPGIGIYHTCKDDPEMGVVWTDLLKLWNQKLPELVKKASQDKSPVDLVPFVETAAERYRTPRARKCC